MTRTPSSRRLAAFAAGAAAIAAYAGASLLSGSLSPLARRPLLDGGGLPQPYRWVKPPPELASINQPPMNLRETIDLSKPERGAGLHGTTDRQAQLILDPNTFPASLGKQKLSFTIDPLDPTTLGAAAPRGLAITGNAYRFRMVTANGADAPAFAVPGHLVLTYPLVGGAVFGQQHTVVRLTGTTWETLQTTEASASLQAATEVSTLGTFAVASKPAEPSPGGGRAAPVAIIGGVGAFVVVGGVVGFLFWRAQQRSAKERAQQRARDARRSGKRR